MGQIIFSQYVCIFKDGTYRKKEVKVKNIHIVAGTHGNELTGIYLLKKWENDHKDLSRDTFTANTFFANPCAFKSNKRYIDSDLNRQFSTSKLSDFTLSNNEQNRAKVIDLYLGPKHAPKTDLIIDLHNTTSNMGPTLVLLKADAFNTNLAAYVGLKMPSVHILLEDHCSIDEHSFLCSIAKQGIIIEVGPQPQSVLRHDIMVWMEMLIKHVLDFVDLYNKNQLPKFPTIFSAFRYQETLSLPLNAKGEKIGMVHEFIQDNDFLPIKKGDPIFQLFNGKEIYWDGDYEAYPHFINEAAYYDNHLAMSLAKKCTLSVAVLDNII